MCGCWSVCFRLSVSWNYLFIYLSLLRHRERIIRSRCTSLTGSMLLSLCPLHCPPCRSGKQIRTNELSDCSTGQFGAHLCGSLWCIFDRFRFSVEAGHGAKRRMMSRWQSDALSIFPSSQNAGVNNQGRRALWLAVIQHLRTLQWGCLLTRVLELSSLAWRPASLITMSLSPTRSNWNTCRSTRFQRRVSLTVLVPAHVFSQTSLYSEREKKRFWPCARVTTFRFFFCFFVFFTYLTIIWMCFFFVFSGEPNATEAARARWCCQLCVRLVTELSTQGSSSLRSRQPAVVSGQQTHFSTTPPSLVPPSLPSHPPSPRCSFCSLISSVVLTLPLALSSHLVSPYILSHLRSPFPRCIISLSAIHPHWTHCQVLSFCSLHLTGTLPPSPLHLHVLSTPLTSPQPPLFTASYSKNVHATEVTGWEYPFQRVRLFWLLQTQSAVPQTAVCVLRDDTPRLNTPSQKQLRGLSSQFYNSLKCFTLCLII